MDFTLKHIETTANIVKERKTRAMYEIDEISYAESDYILPDNMPKNLKWVQFDRNKYISGKDKHFWLRFSVNIPNDIFPDEMRVYISTGHKEGWDVQNPQMLVFIDGKATQGLDVNHREIYLEQGKHDLLIYAYKGMIDSEFKVNISLMKVNTFAQKLYYDLITVKDALEVLGEKSLQYTQLAAKARKALKLIDINSITTDFYESAHIATDYFDSEIWNGEGINELATVSFIGHTHIDVAWLWTIAQTKEKVQRSCVTALKLMERYPDYKFFLSQPVLYEFVKKHLPDVYSLIKKMVREGRWEAEGGMWVEADCNLTGGESLIRQIMYGKAFFKEEFGIDSKILWLPDAFGFSAALPQILKKCNMDMFITSKLSWNETNKYPYDLFMWRGIDGSEILTYFITARDNASYLTDDKNTRYNGYTTPSYLMGAWNRFQQKQYSNEVLVSFGYGDGGGGANEQMLEILERTKKGISGFPKSRSTGLKEYAERLRENFDNACEALGEIPKWYGELYLELHRGTFTAMSEIKKYNRLCELLYQKAEQLSVIKTILFKGIYPKNEIEKGWKNILLNQFHDILPGSSIKEVYDDAFALYEETYSAGTSMCTNVLNDIAKKITASAGILVYNANSFEVSDYVECDGKLVYAEKIPAMGWKVINPQDENIELLADKNHLENKRYSITFNEDGNIISIFDKNFKRELVKEDKLFNAIEMYENIPYCYDAWEISEYYEDKCKVITEAKEISFSTFENFVEYRVKRSFSKSEIIQTTRLYNNSDRINFMADIEWNEEKALIKASFPINIHADEMTADIQFGSFTRPTHRNTSWDRAKFEVYGNKWVDISEDNYGVSIINKSKYGYSCEENELKMTLLTSPKYPNPDADMGEHQISYAIMPHYGRARDGVTVREAYKFNQPLSAVKVNNGHGVIPNEFSLLTISSGTVIAETIKRSEDTKGIIIRMYQSANITEYINIKVNVDVKQCSICDMLENPVDKLDIIDGNLNLLIKPFEIVTVRFEN